MTSLPEDALLACLTEVDELEAIARVGINPDIIPTEAIRPVVAWAIEYFYESGMRRAPSRGAVVDAYGRMLDDAGVVLPPEDEEHDNGTWAIEQLKGQFVWAESQDFLRDFSRAMSDTPMIDRRKVLEQAVADLSYLALSLRDQTYEREGSKGFIDAIARYEYREEEASAFRGMTFGIPEIDQHTYGIHPGELAVLGAPSKIGKSLFTVWVLLNEWRRGRKCVMVTMENSVEMTYDRLICIQVGIDPERWEEGKVTPEERKRFEDFRDFKLPEMKDQIIVIMPDPKSRTPMDIVRYARSHDADSLIIDQLTFMEPTNQRLDGWKAIKSMLHELKSEISYGSKKIPCLLIHQFNRDALKELKKNPEIQPHHYADGSEVERTADWAFGMYASEDDRAAQAVTFQTVLARRRKRKSWHMVWRPFQRNVRVLRELSEHDLRGELKG